jgi:hypothetical protein
MVLFGPAKIEKIINSICENKYNRKQFYHDITNLNLKIDDRVNGDEQWLIFYDSVDPKLKNGINWGMNPQFCVDTVYIAFHYKNNILKLIHIQFTNLSKYRFATEYVRVKFIEIIRENDRNVKKHGKDKYPTISKGSGNFSLIIDYTLDR